MEESKRAAVRRALVTVRRLVMRREMLYGRRTKTARALAAAAIVYDTTRMVLDLDGAHPAAMLLSFEIATNRPPQPLFTRRRGENREAYMRLRRRLNNAWKAFLDGVVCYVNAAVAEHGDISPTRFPVCRALCE